MILLTFNKKIEVKLKMKINYEQVILQYYMEKMNI